MSENTTPMIEIRSLTLHHLYPQVISLPRLRVHPETAPESHPYHRFPPELVTSWIISPRRTLTSSIFCAENLRNEHGNRGLRLAGNHLELVHPPRYEQESDHQVPPPGNSAQISCADLGAPCRISAGQENGQFYIQIAPTGTVQL